MKSYQYALYLTCLFGTFIGFYFWYISFYKPTDDNRKCIISGFSYEINKYQTYSFISYSCLPLLLVDYRLNGEHFYSKKTRVFEMDSFDKSIMLDNLNQTSIDMCLSYLDNFQYSIGKNLDYCYVLKKDKSPSCVCRKRSRTNQEKSQNRLICVIIKSTKNFL